MIHFSQAVFVEVTVLLGQDTMVEIWVVTAVVVTVMAPVIKAMDMGCDEVGDVRVLDVHLVQM